MQKLNTHGYDEYVYNVPKKASTNSELVYAYLKAKYGDEKVSESVVKAEINMIHNNLYRLSFVSETQSYTVTLEDGTTEVRTKNILKTTLSSITFAEYYEQNKNSLLTSTQQKEYQQILSLMQENVGKVLNNPFPRY